VTPHYHIQPVEGCFRCDLSADEARTEMPFDTFNVEATLTWSHQIEDGTTPYLGDEGSETRTLTDYALLEILRSGLRDDDGNVVTSITLWPAIPAREGTHDSGQDARSDPQPAG
jgi:hypothetical protein